MAATKYSEAVLVNKMTDLIKLANVNLNHFPRHEKYGLSQQIRNTMYDVYNLIIEGEKRYHKKTSLTELDVKHQQLRMMLKLAYELDYFKYHNGKTDRSQTETDRRYLALNSLVNEVGAMIGGWIKSESEKMK